MTKGKIVIVGAGISGLAAGRALSERGFDVEIVEARDRVGGRLHTVDGIDLGAHWIHGTEGNPSTNLARRLSLPTLFVGGDATYVGGWDHFALHRQNAGPLPAKVKLQSMLAADSMHERIETWRREHDGDAAKDCSLADLVHRLSAAQECDSEQRHWQDWHITLLAREDWAAGAERLSALNWDSGFEVYGYGDSVLMDGYQAMAERLCEGLRVRLGTVVRRIEHRRSSGRAVRLSTSRGRIDCDAVIVTVPLGVLKAGSIAFDPPLPARKRKAIARLGFGSLTKVVVWFKEPFWPLDRYSFGLVGAPIEDSPTSVVNVAYSHGLPCLAILAGGALGERLEALSPSEARVWAVEFLGKLFARKIPKPTRIQRTEWRGDPFSLGAYSYVAVGATPDDFDTLAAPVGGKLYFAGEATNRQHWGCVHSGYLSGLREAARIAGDSSILPSRHFTENRRWRNQMLRLSRFFDLKADELGDAEIERRRRVLEQSEVFRSVASNEMRLLAMMLEERRLRKGETLCSWGDDAREVYIVSQGRLGVRSREGARIGEAGVAAVVGEYGMFAAMKRQATVIAEQPSKVLALDYPRFAHFLNAFPEALFALMRLTVERFVVRPPTGRPAPRKLNRKAASAARRRR